MLHFFIMLFSTRLSCCLLGSGATPQLKSVLSEEKGTWQLEIILKSHRCQSGLWEWFVKRMCFFSPFTTIHLKWSLYFFTTEIWMHFFVFIKIINHYLLKEELFKIVVIVLCPWALAQNFYMMLHPGFSHLKRKILREKSFLLFFT